MKRSLLMSVCAASLAVVMFTSSAQAVVDVALELRYTDPANESAGGTWRLVTKTSDAGGVAGLSAVLTGINTTGLAFNNHGFGDNGHSIDPANQFVDYGNGAFNVVYGQDLAPVVNGVGTGAGSPGNRATDPFGNSAWNNAAVLITGTFGSTRPGFGTSPTGKVTEANVYSGTTAVAATIGLTNVRGDSVATDGLLPGDANRDGIVNVSDLGIMATNWQESGKGWDEGNFTGTQNDTIVNVSDLGLLATNWQLSRTPPAIAAVPEPSSVMLALLCGTMFLGRRRRV